MSNTLNIPNSNPLTPTFTPFASGCGMCKPSTDYYSVKTGGIGNYSNDGLIPKSNGQNFFKTPNFNKSMNNSFVKDNYGVDYATSFGGKSKNNKSKKGGFYEVNSEVQSEESLQNQVIQQNNYGTAGSIPTGGKKSKINKTKKGGFYEVISEEGLKNQVMQQNKYGTTGSMQTAGKKSKINKTKKGGFYEVSSEEGLKNQVMQQNKYGTAGSMQTAGKKSKINKTKKGGFYEVISEESPDSKIKTGGKKSKKIMKGGMESSGATPLPLRFFDPKAPLDNYPEISGNSIMTSYGQIESGDIGTGMLAPYTASSCSTANHSTEMKTGGKKTKTSIKLSKKIKATKVKKISKDKKTSLIKDKKKMKGGENEYASVNSDELPSDIYASYSNDSQNNILETNYNSQSGGKKSKKSMKGGDSDFAPIDSYANIQETYNNHLSGGKKSKKSMKGGMESSGATSMDQRFYNPSINIDNYNELSGNGIMSAYGPIESGNIGTGMLAPYTASTCNDANQNTDMKTGGSKSIKSQKNIKKILKGGKSGPIPNISDSPVKMVQKTVDGAISGFTNFMQKLDDDYLKSVSYVKTIKIGNQRLIQGGKKVEKKPIEKKPTKKIVKKPIEKKLTKKIVKTSAKKVKKGGSNGSDFALTLNSRGPVNAPDDYWGVPGEEWFKQFNKTGEYIPNSKLAYAATPLLAGVGDNAEVYGYDSMGTDYGSV